MSHQPLPSHHSAPHLRSALKRTSRPSSPVIVGNAPLPSGEDTPISTVSTATTIIGESPSIGASTATGVTPSPAIGTTSTYSSPAIGLSSPPTSYGRLPRALTTGSGTQATPVGYTPKVGFDTFENPIDDAMFSFTLQVKSEGYKRTRKTRVFLCAASPDESGMHALDWALECLCQDDDEFIVVRGFDVGELDKDHDALREEARELMRMIGDKNVEYDPNRKLSIVVEFVAGRITETIERMIALYRPDSLIVGTRGERTFLRQVGQAVGTGVGSVSRYCLSHSPVPVIVVSPHRKRSLEKRRADPKRRPLYDDTGTDGRRARLSNPGLGPTISHTVSAIN